MNIYFSCSIYGGRQKLATYKKLVDKLSEFGTILDKEVVDDDILIKEEGKTDSNIFETLEKKLEIADIIFAEITVPSLGVGYEIGFADSHNKKIIGIYDKTVTPKVTTMIRGNTRLKIIPYTDINEIINDLEKILKEV